MSLIPSYLYLALIVTITLTQVQKHYRPGGMTAEVSEDELEPLFIAPIPNSNPHLLFKLGC